MTEDIKVQIAEHRARKNPGGRPAKIPPGLNSFEPRYPEEIEAIKPIRISELSPEELKIYNAKAQEGQFSLF